MEQTEYCVVFMTCSSEEEAAKIAGALVVEKLAACVNIIPRIRSIYSWKGKIEDDAETMMIAKTRTANFDALKAAVAALHSYDTPEIIMLPLQGGSEKYLAWLAENTARG